MKLILPICFIIMITCQAGDCYRTPFLCPQGYYTNNRPNEICQFCPHVSCYVMKGKHSRNESEKGYYIDCMHHTNLPLEKYVAQKLDCVLMGNYTKLFLFIFPIPLERRKLMANCLKPDFIKPLSKFIQKYTLTSIDVGIPLKNLPTNLLLSMADLGKSLEMLRFSTTKVIKSYSTNTIFYFPYTSSQPQIFLQINPKRNSIPDNNLTVCKYEGKNIKSTNCEVPTIFVKQTRAGISGSAKYQICPLVLDRPAKQIDEEKHDEPIDPHSEYGLLVLMALSLVAFSLFLILSSIFIYYLKHFSKFSPKGKEARAKAKLLAEELKKKEAQRIPIFQTIY